MLCLASCLLFRLMLLCVTGRGRAACRFALDAEFTGVAGSVDTIATHHEGSPVSSDDFASFQFKLESATQQVCTDELCAASCV